LASRSDKGQLDDAIAEYREAIRLNKDYAEPHNSLGNALRDKGRLDDAIAEYHEALRLKKDYAEAHSNLGITLRDKGLLDEAMTECRKSIRFKKDYAEAHNNLGIALAGKGQLDDAIAEFGEAIRLKKDFAPGHYNLGTVLRDKGQLDEAIAEYREALRLKKDFAEAHNNLGIVLGGKGQLDEAIAEFREAIRLQKDDAQAHNNLGFALYNKGQLEEAIAEYREVLRIDKDHANAHDKLRKAEHMVRIKARLDRVLEGKDAAKDAAERLEFAQLSVMPNQKRYSTSVRFFREAFEEKPKLADDLNAQHRYNAACAAALAGCGQGKGADKLDVQERARLRQQALDWLRADLKAYRQVLEKSEGKAGPAIAQRMQHWLQDADFAGVRSDESLARLPEAERKQWHKLWQEVEALRQRATQRPNTASFAQP
jgi:tetratricopeptide (TPR) repeat protein